MELGFRFGTLGQKHPSAGRKPNQRFNLVVLGDFSGRGVRGAVGSASELASRKPRQVDVDNLEDVLSRYEPQLQLPLSGEEADIALTIRSLDDLHPDQLFQNVEIFHELAALRRRLDNPSTYASAADQVQSWLGDLPTSGRSPAPAAPSSSDLPEGELDDLATLLGRESAVRRIQRSVEEMARHLVAPYVVPSRDPAQDEMIAAIDQSLSATMRQILHQDEFRNVESLWRSVDLLTRRLETGTDLQIYLLDISAREFAADLSAEENLDQTALYRWLVEQPAVDAQRPAPSVIVAHYTFRQTAPHASLLGRAAQIAAAAGAPLLAAVDSEWLSSEDERPLNDEVRAAWSALRGLSAARYLGLVCPGFLLRMPYGKSTSPIEPFAFEEAWPPDNLACLLWGNPAVLAGLLLGQSFSLCGLHGMRERQVMTVDDMPFYWYRDEDGDQVAVPCTRIALTESRAETAASQGLMPLLAIRGRNEVHLGVLQSLAGTPLAGPWQR
ncbi:MAG: type VI secretion system contractile sheath large subunit [Planctomycetes bacterium]|nr:type VI secretion system contractile sheath large subunit [Planctomycetota bacterium]